MEELDYKKFDFVKLITAQCNSIFIWILIIDVGHNSSTRANPDIPNRKCKLVGEKEEEKKKSLNYTSAG